MAASVSQTFGSHAGHGITNVVRAKLHESTPPDWATSLDGAFSVGWRQVLFMARCVLFGCVAKGAF